MTTIEDELRELFREQAVAAPRAEALAGRARQALRGRRRRYMRRGAVGVGVASLLGVTVVSVARVHDSAELVAPVAVPTVHDSSPSAVARTGPVTGIPSDAACAIYTPRNAVHAPLAFDGTVTEIGPRRPSPRHGADPGVVVAARFTVHEWFRGDLGKVVTLDLRVSGSIDDKGAAPPFEVGTRLLVSATRAPVGATEGFVWGCEFTRYYDPDTAAQWRGAATR